MSTNVSSFLSRNEWYLVYAMDNNTKQRKKVDYNKVNVYWVAKSNDFAVIRQLSKFFLVNSYLVGGLEHVLLYISRMIFPTG